MKEGFLSKKDFVNQMAEKGYSEEICKEIYTFIVEYLPKNKNNIICLNDDVLVDYSIDEGDIEDFLLNKFKAIGSKFPSTETQHEFYKKYGETLTVERLVQFFCILS